MKDHFQISTFSWTLTFLHCSLTFCWTLSLSIAFNFFQFFVGLEQANNIYWKRRSFILPTKVSILWDNYIKVFDFQVILGNFPLKFFNGKRCSEAAPSTTTLEQSISLANQTNFFIFDSPSWIHMLDISRFNLSCKVWRYYITCLWLSSLRILC